MGEDGEGVASNMRGFVPETGVHSRSPEQITNGLKTGVGI